jgi:hypothetical protein
VRRTLAFVVVAVLSSFILLGAARAPRQDSRLQGAFRRPAENGWTYVHLEGSPAQMGYQHGYLLAHEIDDFQQVTALELRHDVRRDWPFFRDAAEHVLWPHIEDQYRQELQGIADGVRARGVHLDLWDIVALNADMEWSYYVADFNRRNNQPSPSTAVAPEHCSAFVATGSYTRDGKFVIAHNNWTSYLEGERWTIIFDLAPSSGYHMLMDGLPGFIHSGDDFGVNSAGIVITETTISGFSGYDPAAIPEFIRARKAMQFAASIDDYARIMKDGNNGGYANDWLIADRNTNEVASLELGLKNVTLQRTRDGYFVGSNIPIDPNLAAEETNFNLSDASLGPNARHIRWNQLMAEYKGRIDVSSAQGFLADHFDAYEHKVEPSERTLCGHIDLSPRGMGSWQPAYAIAGAVQNKVADAALAGKMSFTAAAGHACGTNFRAAEHLRQHPQFEYQRGFLHDMNSYPWTTFQAH